MDWNVDISNRLGTVAGRDGNYLVQGDENNRAVNKDSEQ